MVRTPRLKTTSSPHGASTPSTRLKRTPLTTHTGCPQAPCDDPLFDVDECPTAGDGTCDHDLNDATCAYDGGDCCASTCQGVNCGPFDCRDPAEARHHDAHAAEDERWRQRGRRGVSGGLVIVIILAVGTFVSCWLRHKRSAPVQKSKFYDTFVASTSTPSTRRSLEDVARRSVRLEAIRFAIKERPVGDGDIAAAAAMVATLSRDVSAAEFGEEVCPICLYELCDGDHGRDEQGLDDDAVVLPCAHAFHGRCLRPWFALAYSDALRAGEAPTLACPVCRAVVPEGEPEA
jgi:hypothetical protein